MAVNLNLSGKETTDFKQIILSDISDNWGSGGNINFTQVLYAEIYVGIRGALYGPVVVTDVFTAATTQNDLVFPITTEDLGITEDTFDDALQTYHYGVSELATPNIIQKNIWNGQLNYDLPFGDTENKIPYTVQGNTVRTYRLTLTISLNTADKAINPKITLNVNYADNTVGSATQVVPQDGTTNTYTLTVEVDQSKEITSISGYLLDEDRTNVTGRSGSITNITLNEEDLDIQNVVKRGLASEKSKKATNEDLIAFNDQILCGRKTFADHERVIVRSLSLRSVTNAATRGLTTNVEGIINFLNDDC